MVFLHYCNDLLVIDTLHYFKLLNKIRGSKIEFTDTQSNKYYIEDAIVDLEKNQIIGKDVSIDFENAAFGNNKNEPRLKGNKIYSNQDITTVSKGIFTTCKKTDSCPPWTMQASEVTHDKTKQIISFEVLMLCGGSVAISHGKDVIVDRRSLNGLV